jgi:exodeoxyribonuclease VII large subunit
LESLSQRRIFQRPFEAVQLLGTRLDELDARARRALANYVSQRRQRATALASQLEALSPLGVLSRGYSVTLNHRTGELIRDAAQVSPDDLLRTKLANGEIVSRVEGE